MLSCFFFFFFQAEDGIRDFHVTGVQTCALPISADGEPDRRADCRAQEPPSGQDRPATWRDHPCCRDHAGRNHCGGACGCLLSHASRAACSETTTVVVIPVWASPHSSAHMPGYVPLCVAVM